MRFLTLGLLACAWVPGLAAQNTCRPAANSNEANALAILSVPLAFSPAAPPDERPGFSAALEGVYMPRVDRRTATPTTCRPGKGPENVNLLFALPRPRIAVPLPLGLALVASWIPPVRVAGVKANLFGVSLAKTVGRAGGLLAAVRAHATFGSVHAPVTCDQAALGDPVSECFGGTKSDDRFSPDIFGADVSLGWSMAAGRLRPYVGAGYNRLQPRFQVHFTNRFGNLDTTRVAVNLNRGVFFGGAMWRLTERLGIIGEVYVAPADAVTGRLVVRRALGS